MRRSSVDPTSPSLAVFSKLQHNRSNGYGYEPEAFNADFERIMVTGANEGELQVIAELVEVLGG